MIHPIQTESVSRLLRQQRALADFGSYALREPLLFNVLREAARVCATTLDVPFSKVCRYRSAENDLLIEAGHGWKENIIGRVWEVNENSPQGRAYMSGQPVIIPNLHEAGNSMLQTLYDEHSIVSTANVIIKSRDGVAYGVLQINSPIQHIYSKIDIDFLANFADILAEIFVMFERKTILQNSAGQTQAIISERDVLVAKNKSLVAENRVLVAENYRLINEQGKLASETEYRIRNGLQIIYSMLVCHLNVETTDKQKSSVRGIIRRVMTLTEIYVQLYRAENSQTINLGTYLASLCDILPDLQMNRTPGIKLICSSETLLVNIDTVTAVGMVVAELVSNSYEHAFGMGAGTISVTLCQSGPELAVLTVGDDGSGFIEQVGSKRHGVGLVRRLMEQVRGSVEHHSERGSIWIFRFPAMAPSQKNRTLH